MELQQKIKALLALGSVELKLTERGTICANLRDFEQKPSEDSSVIGSACAFGDTATEALADLFDSLSTSVVVKDSLGARRSYKWAGFMWRELSVAAAAIGALLLVSASPAEAARCAKGKIYRPSIGACQSKATAARQGVRVRYAKASIRHRYKRPPVRRAAVERIKRAAQATPENKVSAYPPLRPAPRVEPVPRPEWLAGVELFDNLNAQAWMAETDGRALLFGRE
jgi:hypothetical protein